MTIESQVPDKTAIVSQDSEETAITPEVVSDNEIQQQTTALIEAIGSKAFSEAKEAGELARENYLETVRRIREDIENRKLFDPQRIEEAMQQVQKEVEKDWDGIVKEWNNVVKEATSFGDRLNEASKAAWEILTEKNSQ
ncbi:MAG: hypothetical protein QNJ64_21420 [Crocosphaera sp.]|nr:hypothetical protein [Crocosphaera sp.]